MERGNKPDVLHRPLRPPPRPAVRMFPSRAVLQNPLALFTKVLCRELTVAKPHTRSRLMKLVGHDRLAATVHHVAVEIIVSQSRALLVEGWRRFQAEHREIGLTKATMAYVGALRRAGVTVSKSTLFEYGIESDRAGLEGLVCHRHGGRPIRIPAVDRSIVLSLVRFTTPSFRFYLWIRRLGRLPGRPITRAAFEQFIKGLAKTTKAPGRTLDKGRRRASPSRELVQVQKSTMDLA